MRTALIVGGALLGGYVLLQLARPAPAPAPQQPQVQYVPVPSSQNNQNAYAGYGALAAGIGQGVGSILTGIFGQGGYSSMSQGSGGVSGGSGWVDISDAEWNS